MERRSFITSTSALAYGSIFGVTGISCLDKPKSSVPEMKEKSLDISLAQWSLNRAFFAKELDPNNFASIAANEFQIHAIEYVNQFYVDQSKNETFWQDMKRSANNEGVDSLLIMVDDEGDLGDANAIKRKQAAENHFKWVNAAKLMGCHSIRVNAFGEGSKEEVKSALVEGMSILLEYAETVGINVIIENHGLYSSDGKWVVDLIKQVGKSNLGTLPDFGNWCLNEKWGSTNNNRCTESYDPYQGLTDFLPYAKGVSAKAYAFDAEGNESIINYEKMFDIINASDFNGYVGIEYEGEGLSEPDGIRATTTLLKRYI